MSERYAPGEARRLVSGSVGLEWISMPDLVKATGLSRNTIRNCLLQGGFEVRRGACGCLEARRQVNMNDWLRKRWT